MSYPEEALESLYARFPCRQRKILFLLQLFGERHHWTVPSIFIYGNSATGKTSIVSSVLETCKVLDKAERLRDMESNILPTFCRLNELAAANVCVIFITEIIWEKFQRGTGFHEPVRVHFSDYLRDELIEILALQHPANFPKAFFINYLGSVLNTFHNICRNLVELRHLVHVNFPKYVEPINDGSASEVNVRKLWRLNEPHLKSLLKTVYLRNVPSSQLEQQLPENSEPPDAPSLKSKKPDLELPFYSKYLLIAAYLASYNPSRTDRRFFLKNHGKIKKTFKKKYKPSNHVLGPKIFTLDRLLAIFYSIIEERVAPTAHIFSQISTLVTLDLLSQTSSKESLDIPKYKCLVSLDMIRNVARTVEMDIIKYLYDFV